MNLPTPPTPADANLRDFPFMPIDIGRLFASTFHAKANDAEWRAGVTLWLKSYHQVPAGSLPKDDDELCRLAELGRDVKAWRKLKERAMHGWYEADDGRLYHSTVAEKVNEAWRRKGEQQVRTLKARIAACKKRLDEAATEEDRQHIGGLLEGLQQSLSQTLSKPVTGEPTEHVTETNRQGQGYGQGQGDSKYSDLPLDSPAAGEPDPDPSPERQAYELWNEFAGRIKIWKPALRFGDGRRRALGARLRELGGLDGFREVLAKAEASDFIGKEGMRGWGLDWLLKPANMQKVLEGIYDNGRQRAARPGPSSRVEAMMEVVQDLEQREQQHAG